MNVGNFHSVPNLDMCVAFPTLSKCQSVQSSVGLYSVYLLSFCRLMSKPDKTIFLEPGCCTETLPWGLTTELQENYFKSMLTGIFKKYYYIWESEDLWIIFFIIYFFLVKHIVGTCSILNTDKEHTVIF